MKIIDCLNAHVPVEGRTLTAMERAIIRGTVGVTVPVMMVVGQCDGSESKGYLRFDDGRWWVLRRRPARDGWVWRGGMLWRRGR